MELPSLSSSADEPVLLHELHHRVNNEFAAAISVVSLAAARSSNDEAKTALASVTELLHHFASVHHALQVPERGDAVLAAEAYLSKLCLSISRSYLDHKNIKLSLAIEPLLLPADVSWRLGMIVYELIINGMRHAFAAGGGEIHVSVRRYAGFVKCIVQDDGSAAPNIRPGRGLKIVEALSNSLGGRLRQTFGPRGSTTMLIFPCGANSRRGAAAEKGSRPQLMRPANKPRRARPSPCAADRLGVAASRIPPWASSGSH